MIARTPKQKLLNTLSMVDLKNLVDRFDLAHEIKKGQSRENLLRDLSRLKRVSVEHVIENLSRDALQMACRELGLDDSGHDRKMAQLILARFGKSGKPLGHRAPPPSPSGRGRGPAPVTAFRVGPSTPITR